MSRESIVRRLAIPSMGVAFTNLVVLGLLIGWVGASRAYAVGLETLFRDHLTSVVVVLAATAVLAGFFGRTLRSASEVLLAIGFAVAADVVAALAVTLMIDEMRRFPMLPRAVLAETAGGLQIACIALALAIGYLVRDRSNTQAARVTFTDAD